MQHPTMWPNISKMRTTLLYILDLEDQLVNHTYQNLDSAENHKRFKPGEKGVTDKPSEQGEQERRPHEVGHHVGWYRGPVVHRGLEIRHQVDRIR